MTARDILYGRRGGRWAEPTTPEPAAHKRYVPCVGGPLDGCRLRIDWWGHADQPHTPIVVPMTGGAYILDGDRYRWEVP